MGLQKKGWAVSPAFEKEAQPLRQPFGHCGHHHGNGAQTKIRHEKST